MGTYTDSPIAGATVRSLPPLPARPNRSRCLHAQPRQDLVQDNLASSRSATLASSTTRAPVWVSQLPGVQLRPPALEPTLTESMDSALPPAQLTHPPRRPPQPRPPFPAPLSRRTVTCASAIL